MRPISTQIHGLIDYSVGTGLLFAPQLLGMEDPSTATTFTRAMGAAALAYSACTDYELGLLPVISMPAHLSIDRAWALSLAAGPWLLHFARKGRKYWLLHALVAVAAAGVVALSDPQPKNKKGAVHNKEPRLPEEEKVGID